jgi:hypothetical protein
MPTWHPAVHAGPVIARTHVYRLRDDDGGTSRLAYRPQEILRGGTLWVPLSRQREATSTALERQPVLFQRVMGTSGWRPDAGAREAPTGLAQPPAPRNLFASADEADFVVARPTRRAAVLAIFSFGLCRHRDHVLYAEAATSADKIEAAPPSVFFRCIPVTRASTGADTHPINNRVV